MNEEIRNQFPVLQQFTYLNTASSGILATDIYQDRRDHDRLFLEGASLFRDKYLEYVWDIKKTIGSVFSCPPERIGLIPNYSWGINALSEGLSRGLKVLTVKNEYPSVVEPFRTRGFEIVVSSGPTHQVNYLLSEIEDKKPNILLISAIQWTTGQYITNDDFRKIKKEYPDLLILVDGTQSVGTAPLDFIESGIDAMITSGYKWLGAGYGNGFIMLSDRMDKYLDLKLTGNNTIMDRLISGRNNIGQVWEPGHIDTLNFITLQKAIQKLDKIGLANIEKQINKLALTIKTGLVQSGYLPATSLGGNKHSGIVLIPGSSDMVKALKKENIIVSFRDGIRVSYHYYNTKEDVYRFLDAFRMLIG